jgi:hypothetical protein
MKGLNLHNVVSGALAIVNPFKELILIKQGGITYNPDGTTTTTPIEINTRGKMQPIGAEELQQMGVTVLDHRYYKFYITGDITQINQVLSLGCDFIICEGKKYNVVGTLDFSQDGWMKAMAYLELIIEN